MICCLLIGFIANYIKHKIGMSSGSSGAVGGAVRALALGVLMLVACAVTVFAMTAAPPERS